VKIMNLDDDDTRWPSTRAQEEENAKGEEKQRLKEANA